MQLSSGWDALSEQWSSLFSCNGTMMAPCPAASCRSASMRWLLSSTPSPGLTPTSPWSQSACSTPSAAPHPSWSASRCGTWSGSWTSRWRRYFTWVGENIWMEPSVSLWPWVWAGSGTGGSGCALLPPREDGDRGFLHVPSCWHLGQQLRMLLGASGHPRTCTPDPGGSGSCCWPGWLLASSQPCRSGEKLCGDKPLSLQQTWSLGGCPGVPGVPLHRSLQPTGTDPSPTTLVGCRHTGLIPKWVGGSPDALVGLNLGAICSLSGSDSGSLWREDPPGGRSPRAGHGAGGGLAWPG